MRLIGNDAQTAGGTHEAGNAESPENKEIGGHTDGKQTSATTFVNENCSDKSAAKHAIAVLE